MDADAEIEQHNRRELWRDAANHLRVAWESMEQAQSALEDLDDASDVTENLSRNLTFTIGSVKRFASFASKKVEEAS